jgi:hypothetical protein
VQALPFEPSGTLKRLSFYGAIGAEIELSEPQPLLIETWATSQCIADARALRPRAPSFHVTLGYCYRPLEQVDVGQVNAALAAISTDLAADAASRALKFSPASLCVFKDMTGFAPWDASSNPF